MRRRIVAVATALLVAIAVGAGLAAADATPAEISITQPEYVDDSVETEHVDGEVVYRVHGPRHIISLTDVDHGDVTGYGVADGGGDLTYHPESDHYVFEADGNGSVTLYWTEHVEDGNTTSTARHEAVLQVSSVTWVHRTGSEDAALQEDASRFQEIEREVSRLAPGEDVDDVISAALTYWRFFDAPLSTLIDDMRGTLLMMALRPGGWIIAGIFIGISLLGVLSGARFKNRAQKQFRDIGDIEVEKTEAYLQKAERILSNCDYNDFLPDDAARAMRDLLGRNPWIGFKTYLLLRSPTHVKGVVLQMMAEIGYVGRVERAADGSVVDAWVERDTDSGPRDADVSTDGGATVESVDLTGLRYETEADREFINAIPGEALDFDVFHREMSPDAVDFPVSNRDVDDAELLEALNPSFPDDFEDEEHLARALGKCIEFVCNHDHTDAWGRPERELDLLSFLAEMDSVLSDEADFPVGHVQRRMLVYIADNMDKEDEMTETVDRLQEDGVQ